MPNKIDRVGTFLATVTSTAFGVTKKSDLPQLAIKLTTTKKWADTQEEFTHYGITEPAYVDFPDFEVQGYLCLYSRDGKESKNYEQVVKVFNWSGQDFQDLNDIGVGTTVLVRVNENSYTDENGNDKGGLQLAWLDTADSSPVSTLQPLAADKTAALTAKFLKGKQAPPPAAKPAAAAKVPSAPKATTTPATPSAAPVAQPGTPAAAPSVAAAPTTKPLATKKAPPASRVAAPPVPPSESTGLATSCTKRECWNHINTPAIKGDNEDNVIEEAFFSAIAEVAPNIPDDKLTPEDWAKVRDTVIRDLK